MRMSASNAGRRLEDIFAYLFAKQQPVIAR